MRVSRRIIRKWNELIAAITRVEQYVDLEESNVEKNHGE